VTKEKKSLLLNGQTRKEKSHYAALFFAYEKLCSYFAISICNARCGDHIADRTTYAPVTANLKIKNIL